MLMPNATDLLAGRDYRLARPTDLNEDIRRESYDPRPSGMIRRLARATGRLMSLAL